MTVLTFTYSAVDADGAVQSGTIESDSADAAASSLLGRKLVPLSLEPAGKGLNREVALPSFRGRTTVKDLAVLTRQFASMTSSGLTLLRTLAILEAQTTRPVLKEALRQVHSDVQSGTTLSAAMSRHPDQFPALMVNMVAAGETGGFLDDALSRIAGMYESDAALRGKIKAALTYPVVVLVFSVLMMTGVLLFIVPVFERMFEQLGGTLPLPTRIMVTLSDNAGWLLPLALVLVVAAWKLYRRRMRDSHEFRARADALKLKLPVFGPLATKMAISRWARNLGTLLSVGVPVIQALDIVGGTSGNTVIADGMVEVRDSVRTGSPMSRPLSRQPVFPPMVVQMLEVGEESGRTSEMLDKVADFYDREVEATTESLSSSMEPLLVVLIGAVIGVMVVCLYLPMFSIYQNIGGN